MRRKSVGLCIILGLSMLVSCATPYGRGRAALQQGHYDRAASYFREVLAADPGRLEALVGLGVSRYKLGAFAEAADTLSRAVSQAPRHTEARLYLGLSFLRRGDDSLADEQLTALLDFQPEPRLAAQVRRALQVIRTEQPLSEELRDFIAASLEDEVEWAREVEEARRAARLARYASSLPTPFLFPTRCGRLLHCF